MNPVKITIAAITVACTLSTSNAQDMTILLQLGDLVPGVGTVDAGFSNPFPRIAVTDSGDWMIQFEYDDTNDDALMRNGVVLFQDGDAPPGGLPVGTTIAEFDSWHMNNLGDVAWGLLLNGTPGGTADNAFIYVNDQVAIQKGLAPPGVMPAGPWNPGTVWLALDEPYLTETGQLIVRGRVNDPISTPTSDWFCSIFQLPGVGGAVTSESVLVRAGEVLNGQIAPNVVNTVRAGLHNGTANALGHVIFGCDLNVTTMDGVCYLNTAGSGGANNTLIAQEGIDPGGFGQPWGGLVSPEFSLNSAGDWIAKDQFSGPTADVIVKNNAIYRIDGSSHPAFMPETITSFGTGLAQLTADGRVLWFGDFTGDTGSDTGYFLEDRLIMREGVTTIGAQTITQIRGQSGEHALSPNGRYLIANVRVANVQSIILVDLLEATGSKYCFGIQCPCANDDPGAGCVNSTGVGASLDFSGDDSVSSDGAVLTATDCPPNNSGLCFGGDTAFIPPVLVGDGFGCAGGSSFRYFPSTVDNGGTFIKNQLVSTSPPGFITPGDTRFFQVWTRDVLCGPPPMPCPSPCGQNSNLTNAVAITFVP